MRRDEIYRDLDFLPDFSAEDWNALIKLKLAKYFIDETIFEKNRELLRTEIVNYLRLSKKPEYIRLFQWTYSFINDCVSINKQKTIRIMAESFDEVSNTDMKWMTNVLTQPDSTSFSERDKISYYFKVIDETLEGVFKPRFKLLCNFINFNLNQKIDDSSRDFGKLIKDLPSQIRKEIRFYLEDPIFSISTNQWRNIAAHKSFKINKDNLIVEYGKANIRTIPISFDDFYKIVHWTQDIYRAIRLAQVFIDLNYIEEIVAELGGKENINVRFESSLFHLIHNMQIVGFKFVSTDEQMDTFCLNVQGKNRFDVKSSLIHASQCLDQLSCAIYDDKFVRDSFKKTKISIVDENQNILASATVSIEIAIKKVNGEIELTEYLDNMNFEMKI